MLCCLCSSGCDIGQRYRRSTRWVLLLPPLCGSSGQFMRRSCPKTSNLLIVLFIHPARCTRHLVLTAQEVNSSSGDNYHTTTRINITVQVLSACYTAFALAASVVVYFSGFAKAGGLRVDDLVKMLKTLEKTHTNILRTYIYAHDAFEHVCCSSAGFLSEVYAEEQLGALANRERQRRGKQRIPERMMITLSLIHI